MTPDRLAERLHELGPGAPGQPLGQLLTQAESLLTETVTPAERTAGTDLGEFRAALAERRRPHDPPRPVAAR